MNSNAIEYACFCRSFRDRAAVATSLSTSAKGTASADIYGFKRFFYYWLSKNIVSSAEAFVPGAANDRAFDRLASRVLARQVMARCARVFSRDQLSTDYLGRFGVSGTR